MRAVIDPPDIQRFAAREGRISLLVSVRDEVEALAAAQGGADLIDIKEPDNGPLGQAGPQTIRRVVDALRGRLPVTAAAGELTELSDHQAERIASQAGLSAVKFGLFDQDGRDWANRLEWLRSANLSSATIVPVAYADHTGANSPVPITVIQQAASMALPCVVLDTWNKTDGSLFDSVDAEQVGQLLVDSRRLGVHMLLAGSLRGRGLAIAADLAPWMIGVRGAVCEGGRSGRVVSDRVKRVKQTLETHTPAAS